MIQYVYTEWLLTCICIITLYNIVDATGVHWTTGTGEAIGACLFGWITCDAMATRHNLATVVTMAGVHMTATMMMTSLLSAMMGQIQQV